MAELISSSVCSLGLVIAGPGTAGLSANELGRMHSSHSSPIPVLLVAGCVSYRHLHLFHPRVNNSGWFLADRTCNGKDAQAPLLVLRTLSGASLELSQCWTPQQLWSFVDGASYSWKEVVIQIVLIWKTKHLVLEIRYKLNLNILNILFFKNRSRKV